MNPDTAVAITPPDYEREHHAVAALSQEMADNPRHLLHALVEAALDICDARTAGISLIDGDELRPHAIAGVAATSPDSVMGCDPSADGLCLLVPFHNHGTPVGTLWIVAHNADRKFDAEDERIVGVLAKLASAGWQLWKASEVLATDSRSKDDFLATLAHELRNPLGAIAAAAAVLQQRTQPPSDSHAVAVIARQTHHMTRLIADLLDIARIVSGKLELQTRPLDLRAVATDAVETRRAQIDRRGQVLTFDLCQDPVMVEGDPVRLAQAISNLVDNAAKYTPEQGTISIVVSCDGPQASVVVSDSGAGIPAAEAERIFLPFTQVHKSAGSAQGGLGLGLPLVRTLAELHGGTVSVNSAGAGHGSCFTLRLPAAESAPDA